MDDDPRTDPPLAGSETEILLGFLAFHRDTFRLKTSGLNDEQLAVTLAPSPMTLGGMIKHLAYVESNWFVEVLLGHSAMPPFDTAPWAEDHDWEWHTAAADGGDAVRALYERAVAEAERITTDALAEPAGLDALAVRGNGSGERPSLRWILVHMIEEYCRHNGHADLIRESIDGQTGE